MIPFGPKRLVFSKNTILREKVLTLYPDAKFNDEGVSLYGKELINFLKGYKKAITALEEINEDILKELPDLSVIGKYGVGLDPAVDDKIKKTLPDFS